MSNVMANVRTVKRVSLLAKHIQPPLFASFQTFASDSVMASGKDSNGKSTVGLIVIGDEILKGQTQDTNSHFLTRRLFSLGVKVCKISVIPDDLDIIANEVLEFSRKYTHVITSGGIGPTHDDLTFEGVARAFGEKVAPHPELVKLCKRYFGTDDLKSPKLKLAFIPESASLKYGQDKSTGQKTRYPLVVVRNVYVFPGVPSLMETAFKQLEDLFRDPCAEFHTCEVYIDLDEFSITTALNETNDCFKDRVIIGSYPNFHNNYYKVKVTMEAKQQSDVDAAVQFFQDKLPKLAFVDFDSNPVGHAVEKVDALASSSESFASRLKHAQQVVMETFDRYPCAQMCVGFNGGKDCTALLHLVHAVMSKRRQQGEVFPRLQALYIRRGQPFPEVELFIRKCVSNYDLDLITVDGRIKDALLQLKSSHPHIAAVLMGTRRSDPNSAMLNDFSPTDPDWPAFMRVSPLLDWSYADTWTFIRSLCLPYCTLYDHGYTSLGGLENTHPNPQLRIVDSKGIVAYQPAYKLANGNSERAGRN